MPRAVTVWTKTRRARARAEARAVIDGEIASVLADPNVEVDSAQDPRLRYVGRAGLYLVIDPRVHSIVAVDGQQPRSGGHLPAPGSVKIRRRPVPGPAPPRRPDDVQDRRARG